MKGWPGEEEEDNVESLAMNLWMCVKHDEDWGRIEEWQKDETPGTFCLPAIAKHGYSHGTTPDCACRDVFPITEGEPGKDWFCMAVEKDVDCILEFLNLCDETEDDGE